jgi:hypothetical protein
VSYFIAFVGLLIEFIDNIFKVKFFDISVLSYLIFALFFTLLITFLKAIASKGEE